MRKPAAIFGVIALSALSMTLANASPAVDWQPWSPDIFSKAAAQHRFVLLDLEAVWCHWCHVMDSQTYADPKVITLMNQRYIAVKVDQDSDPDLSNRYGDYGWPATIVFAADGSEIVKRQGYMEPTDMAALLQAIIDDPSPGPSVHPQIPVKAGDADQLTGTQRKALQDAYLKGYDAKYGGWGDFDKYIDADAMDYALLQSRSGAPAYPGMARQTLDAARMLIDPAWGGVDQYSATVDWKTPHYEKIISIQATYLRIYSQAYAQWHVPADLDAAHAIYGYLDRFLKSPEGAFYVSQDADLNRSVDGGKYYSLSDAERRGLGIPRVDTHVYARENGWAIRALTSYYDATGDASALAEAGTAAHYILLHCAREGGGFRHGIDSAGGPYLGDNLAMAEAFLDLYRSSGDRAWLQQGRITLDYIQAHFQDRKMGGYMTAPIEKGARGVLRSDARLPDENATLVRVARLAYAYTGLKRYQSMADHAMHYLASPGLIGSEAFEPGTLMADAEMAQPPVHITVVGHKDDAAAQALHAAALAYAVDFKQIDWWDKREGALPNPEVTYPELPHAAAFICTGNTCSSPIFDAARIGPTAERLSH